MTILRIPPLEDNEGTVASTVTVRLVDSSGRPLIGLRTTDGVPCTTCISQYLDVDDEPWELDLTPQTEIATSDGEPTFYAVSMRASDRALTWLLQLADSATAIDLVDAIGATAIDPADVLSGIVALAPVRQTLAEWADAPVLLAAGQMGIDTTRRVMRVGDGETSWSELPDYAGVGMIPSPLEDAYAAIQAADPNEDDRLAKLSDIAATTELTDVLTPAIDAGVLTLDLQTRHATYHRVTLTEDVTSVVLINPPASGAVRAFLRLEQATPTGTTYAVPQTAWADIASGVFVWRTPYHVYQDATPTDITLFSLDAMGSIDGSCNAPADQSVVEIATNTTLAWATHEGARLVCTAAVTLTVNGDTEFAEGGYCDIDPQGGDVTIAASGATVNSVGAKLTVSRYGAAVLRRATAADTYTLIGTLA